MRKVTITVAGREVELRATMYRLKLLQEHTGVDLLNDSARLQEVMRSDFNAVTGALFALAGGERKLGMELDDFADELSLDVLQEVGEKLTSVFERDTAPREEATGPNAVSPTGA